MSRVGPRLEAFRFNGSNMELGSVWAKVARHDLGMPQCQAAHHFVLEP